MISLCIKVRQFMTRNGLDAPLLTPSYKNLALLLLFSYPFVTVKYGTLLALVAEATGGL